MTESSVAALKALAEETLPKKYETKYSSYVCENPDEIKARVATVDEKWVELTDLRDVKKKVLEDALALEQEKERLRMEYTHAASEFTKWVKETSNNLGIETFGFTLEEVQEYKKTIDSSCATLTKEGDKAVGEIRGLDDEMKKIGVKENVYCQLTVNDIAEARQSLSSALQAREAAYQKELQRQIDDDNLCQEFAAAAEPVSKWIIEQKDTVTASKETLESQLVFVEGKLGSAPTDAKKLDVINALAKKMDERGITNNRHTTLTVRDVTVQWEQYIKFLEAKRDMLVVEIEHLKLRGITK